MSVLQYRGMNGHMGYYAIHCKIVIQKHKPCYMYIVDSNLHVDSGYAAIGPFNNWIMEDNILKQQPFQYANNQSTIPLFETKSIPMQF